MRAHCLSLLLLFAPLSTLSCASKAPEIAVPVASPPETKRQTEATAPRLATLTFPGNETLSAIARTLVEARFALSPSTAGDAGLLDDAIRVPSYRPEAVAGLVATADAQMAALQQLPWDSLTTDEQIDARWLYANAEELRHSLTVEKRWQHRPSEWLEPAANTLLALATYGPDRPEIQVQLAAQIPGMVQEMTELVTEPTARDVSTASDVAKGLVLMLETLPESEERTAATEALRTYLTSLEALTDLPEYRVIGEASYEWRLNRFLLLPWTADELLAVAQKELERVDAEIATLQARAPESAPITEAEQAAAAALTRDGLLALYEDLVAQDLAALRTMNVVTVADDLPLIRARETPAPLIPLTGDGGSMNPPPLFGPQMVGWWNVENFSEDWTQEQRLNVVVNASRHHETWFGPYAVHEGVPGHHLQLAQVRANPNPVRTILWDNPTVEGWGLYAEELFWEGGGFGESDRARLAVLHSYRFRIRRVIYDVNVATGRWSLQEGADWKQGTPDASIDRDVLRAIQWPTQLIGYFTGKKQIMDLRDEVRSRQGESYSEQAFNDAILAAGLIPMPLIRARLLGLPVPPIPSPDDAPVPPE